MGAALLHPRRVGHHPRCRHGHRGIYRLGHRGRTARCRLLIAEGELPIRLRSYYLSDADLDTLAGRARALRADGGAVIDFDAKRKGA